MKWIEDAWEQVRESERALSRSADAHHGSRINPASADEAFELRAAVSRTNYALEIILKDLENR